MEHFLKKIIEGRVDEDSKNYFLRFGRGDFRRRFLISFDRGKKIKIRASFELANDFVNFVRENKELKFSGKVLTREKVKGRVGKKKAGSFSYEISESSIEEFENVYYYLLSADGGDIVLKIKKSLPKPGKDEEKVDDKFCSLDLDSKYWEKVKNTFFWDVPDCKKAKIEHEIIIEEIEIPEGLENKDSVRRMAIKKGRLIRRINCDGREIKREHKFRI